MATKRWNDYYDKFEEIIDRFWDDGEDRIRKEVDKYYKTVKGDPAADEAYRRWKEPKDDECVECVKCAEEYDDRELTDDELDECDVIDDTEDEYIQGASKMPELAATAERIADEIADFLAATTRIYNLDDYLDDEDMGALGKSCDALNDFAQSYSYDEGYR